MKLPTMTPLKSSNIEATGHDKAGLHIRFKGGGHYTYPDAGEDVHKRLVAAESPGSFFRSEIMGKFSHRRHDV